MTLHQLRIFAAVAKQLSITNASKELHISQPSISQQLKLLEEELGLKLHKKDGRGIDLTREGRLFLIEAEPIQCQLEKLKKKFSREMTDKKSGSLTVGGSHGPAALFLPSLACVFRETHPRTQVTLRIDSSFMMEQMVQNSDVQIAVITNNFVSPSLVYERCSRHELVFFASPGHPLNERGQLTVAELAQLPLVIFRKGKMGGVGRILNQIEERGFHANIVMHCDSPEAVKNAVKTGAGLGISYTDILEPDIRRHELKVIQVPGLEMHIDSFIIYPKEKPLSSDAKDFLALLRRWPRRNPMVKNSLGAESLTPLLSPRHTT